MVERKCAVCGKTFQAANNAVKLCSEECRRRRSRERYDECIRRSESRKPRRNTLKKRSLADVEREARAAGKSYGSYVNEIEGRAIVVRRKKKGGRKDEVETAG